MTLLRLSRPQPPRFIVRRRRRIVVAKNRAAFESKYRAYDLFPVHISHPSPRSGDNDRPERGLLNACIPIMDSEHNHSLSHPFFPGEHSRRGTSCPQSPASTRTSITCDCIYHSLESMPYPLLPSPKTYLHAMHVLVHAHQVLHAHQVSGNPMHKINFWSILTCRHVTTCCAF